MSRAEQALATLRDYVERSTHWQEGGADRHAALYQALPQLEASLQELNDDAEPVGSISRAHIREQQEPWCREVLLYSSNNPADSPEHRVMLYTGGRLGDALDWAEKGLAEWRSLAQANAKAAEAARATASVATRHLETLLRGSQTPDEVQSARDWLTSIGR